MLRKLFLTSTGMGLLLALLLLAILSRTGVIVASLPRPDGQGLWFFSRAAGVTAYVALTLATAWGLLLSTAIADAWVSRGRSVEAHRWLSAAAIGLSLAHGVALIGDRYISFDLLDVFVPFLSSYRPFGVGIGIIALYLAVAVQMSFALRAWLGMRAWRAIHLLSFPSFGLITLHGLLAGTDASALWLQFVYAGAVVLVGTLTVYRVGLSLPAGGGQQAHAPAATNSAPQAT